MKSNKQGSLDGFKLYYEEMEKEPVKTSKVTKPVVATKVSAVKRKTSKKDRAEAWVKNTVSLVRTKFNNTIEKAKQHRKSDKKPTKKAQNITHYERKRGIIGIGLLFVVVSIAYSTYVTRTFVDSTASLVALAPQVIFAVITLLIAFYKIYK